MTIGYVMNRCSCSYVDQLLQNTSVHRGKSIQYIFQRLIVVCGRAPPSVSHHAAKIILSAFEITEINAPSKRFIDESTAISLFLTIAEYATEECPNQSEIEKKGAQRCFTELCQTIVDAIIDCSINDSVSIVRNFAKKILNNLNQSQSLSVLNKVTANEKVRKLLQPLFFRFNEFPDFFSSLGRTKFEPLTLIDIVTNYISKDLKEVGISGASSPKRIANHLVKAHRQNNTEVIQALIALLLRKTKNKTNAGETMDDDEVDNVINKLCGNNVRRSVRDTIGIASRCGLVRLLECHGTYLTEDESTMLTELRSAVVQKNLVTSVSVGVALKYMVVLTSDLAESLRKQQRVNPFNDDEQLTYWNGRVFVKAINEFVASLDDKEEIFNWTDAIKELDSPEFFCEEKTLTLLSDVFNTAFPNNSFPVNFLYEPWKYRDSQMTILATIAEFPKILQLSRLPHTKVLNPSITLKQIPDDYDPNVALWNCLEYTTCLLLIGIRDGIVIPTAGPLFKHGFLKCPDVAILALLQSNAPWTAGRIDILKELLPTFILQSTNVVSILNYAWNDALIHRNVKSVIVNSFAVLYDQYDQQKLARILDVAHELKPSGLSEVLSLPVKHLQFIIDLACLASKRDYLKIEKWLEDKEKAFGEAVTIGVLSHIQRRYKIPQIEAALNKPAPVSRLSADPINVLLLFANSKATPQIRKQFSRIFEIMKENSGRSSSVSSTGGRNSVQIGPAVFGSGPPPPGSGLGQDQRSNGGMQPSRAQFAPGPGSNFAAAGQPPQSSSSGLGLLMNVGPFSNGNRDLIKFAQPSASPQPSMSPSNQMLRSQIIPPMAQRQNSNSGNWLGVSAGNIGRPVHGAPQHMDYRQVSQGNSSGSQIQQNMNEEIASVNFSSDVGDEANSYFEQIYNNVNPMSVNDLIALLKTFKNSKNPREQKVLACVVKNLFEEYRFFHEYPEKELKTTAAVYGGIIREEIIENVQFATAFRKVIESLKSEPGSMLWTFGIFALQNCRMKLYAYPKVCSMIAALERFSKFPQNLKDYVLCGIKGELPAENVRNASPIWSAVARASSTDPKLALPANRTGNSILSYTNVDTLVAATEKDGAEIQKPSEAVVDKISFLFNNLSQANLDSKRDEIIGMMEEHGESFTQWLAQYIVMKRVSIEQNFQPLYNQFVQAINSPILDNYLKKETFRNIKILLRTDKRTTALSNYSDRQLLKNLGLWLGAITIARNKPILLNELDLKSLLLEAYYKGQAELLFVVPFISKILLSCSKTELFTPSCAWIQSILKVLAELHNEPDLKINLKFEIEVLCKELNVDLNSLHIDDVLKDTEKLVRVPEQLCEVKVLERPDVRSPVPSNIRVAGSTDPLMQIPPAVEKSVPQPEGNDLLSGSGNSSNQGETTQPNVNHFAYHDINVRNYDGIIPHLKVQPQLPLFLLHPHAKNIVRPAVINAIKELIGPVTERALKIAMTVTESMIKKDFSMDPNEENLKLAAFHMMRAMTAGMAMITCRDPLASTMITSLTSMFTSNFRSNTSPELRQKIDEAAQQITNDNVELSTNFIVKTACEKASIEIEKRLEAEYQKRLEAKEKNTPYRDEVTMSIQKKLPAKIAIAPGTIDKTNLSVYEQFSTRICGFKPTNEELASDLSLYSNVSSSASGSKELESIIPVIQNIVKGIDQATQQQTTHINSIAFQAILMLRENLSNVVTMRDPQALVILINQSVEHLLRAYHLEAQSKHLLDVEWSRRLRDLFSVVMSFLQSHFSPAELSRRITTAVINIRADYKWNLEGIEVLIKHQLLQTTLWDQHLAASMDSGGNLEATLFAQKFVRSLGAGDYQKLAILKEKFPLTCDQLTKFHQMQSATRSVDTNNGAGTPVASTGGAATPLFPQSDGTHTPTETLSQRGSDDQEMNVKVEIILREWITLCYTPTGQRNPQEALSQMIQLMHDHGVLATDDKITQFFRLCVEMCVDVSVRLLKNDQQMSTNTYTHTRQRCYYTLDAFVKLMALMIRHSDNGQSQNKINLLKKLLNIVVGVLHMDHEIRRNDFNALPYHRILITLFNEITGPDPQRLLEPIAWSILEAFGQTFFALQPRRMPGFAFAWLDIVGNRNVIGRLLANTGIAETVDSVKTAATFTQLIISHLKFLAPFLRNIQLPKSIAILYKGTLRVLLVILHDFPELLCEFHYVICDTIPPNCVQLRNLVLSAYPRNMRLPDPFALNFKQVDNIPEMSIEPKSNLNMASIIPESIRIPLDDYLANRSSVEFLSSLPSLLQNQNVPGSKYNTTVMNAIVLYVGIRAIESLYTRRQRISIHTIAHTSYMDIFQNLAVQLCTEGRYLLFNGIANQLRYPNAHTHYFSCVFLFLFRNSDCAAIQEQITRILFERLVALRPHPWGLLITFIELIKNPTYNFWKYEFTRCAPEIERLFQNVANTCVPTPSASNTAVAVASSTSGDSKN